MNRGHEDWIEVTSCQWGIDGENDTLLFSKAVRRKQQVVRRGNCGFQL